MNWPLIASLLIVCGRPAATGTSEQEKPDLSKTKFDMIQSCYLHYKSRLTLEYMNPIIYKFRIIGDEIDVQDKYTLDYTDEALRSIPFDKTVPSKFKVIGFGEEFTGTGIHQDYGVINDLRSLVYHSGIKYDFYVMSTTPPTIDGLISLMRSYPRIAAATKTLGAYLGKFLLDLHRVHNYNLDQMHLIGFSLGAHVSGFAGKYVRANSNQTIGHITGLDPAGPCFRDNKAQDRLDRMDARYVDVIHTAGYSYGISQRIGHRDIYVNGGKKQPHCKIWNMNCQHCFVASLYSKRRSGCQAVAYQCGSYEQFEAGHCPDCENNESRCTLVQSAQQSMVTESEARNYRAAYPSEEELANKSQDFKFNYPKFMDKYYIKTGSTRVRPGQTTRFNNICLYHYQVKVKSSIAINKKSLLLTTLVPEYSSPLIKMQVNLKSFKTNLYTGLLTFSDMEAPLLFKEGEITIDSGSNQNDMPEIQLKIEFMSNMDPAMRAKYSTTLCGSKISNQIVTLIKCASPDEVRRQVRDAFKELESS